MSLPLLLLLAAVALLQHPSSLFSVVALQCPTSASSIARIGRGFPRLHMLLANQYVEKVWSFVDEMASLNVTMSSKVASSFACQLLFEDAEKERTQDKWQFELETKHAHQMSELNYTIRAEHAHQMSELNYTIRAISAQRRRDLSNISKRVVLEGVLRAIVIAIPKCEPLQKALNVTPITKGAKSLMLLGDTTVRM